jgi:uncharacterized protein YeaO (DUF488 family)
VLLYRAPVALVKSGAVTRRGGHLAVVMRHYPRYLKKEMVDEYVRALAPAEDLFAEFKAKERADGDHNAAFAAVGYEGRFALSAEGLAELGRLCEVAKGRDVQLICQCGFEQRCHVDLLLLTARSKFGALTAPLPFRYPEYEERLKSL